MNTKRITIGFAVLLLALCTPRTSKADLASKLLKTKKGSVIKLKCDDGLVRKHKVKNVDRVINKILSKVRSWQKYPVLTIFDGAPGGDLSVYTQSGGKCTTESGKVKKNYFLKTWRVNLETGATVFLKSKQKDVSCDAEQYGSEDKVCKWIIVSP